MTRDGSIVFVVNPDSRSVSALNISTDQKIGEVEVGEDPRSLALSPDGSYLYVTSQRSHTLTILDTRTLAELDTIEVGFEPYGVVADPRGMFVYLASSGTGKIEVVNLRRRRVSARIDVDAKPKGLAISTDGKRLYVTHFLSGKISVVNLRSRRVLQVISTGSDTNMAQKIAIHPTNGRAYLPHIRSNAANPNLLFDSTVFPTLSVIDLVSNQNLPQERVDLSLGPHSVNLPFDVAFSPDGRRAYTVNLGSGDLTVVDLATARKIVDIDVGDGPRGIVITPDGQKAYVTNSLSEDVSVVDLNSLKEVKRVPITTSPIAPEIKRGKLLFFSSKQSELSKERWMSCASCHFEGEHDGRTWIFAVSGPRNTTSLRGLSDTRPLHWSADRDEVQDFEFTIRSLQAGSGLIEGMPNPALGPTNAGLSADLDALAAFVESLQPKSSPFLNKKGSLTRAAIRGQRIFERADVGCVSCHYPPSFSDSDINNFLVHNVGTGNGPDERLGPFFDTPSLRGIWDTAPYLHDGSAATLMDVLTAKNPGDAHGHTSRLSKRQLRDLIEYLRSL